MKRDVTVHLRKQEELNEILETTDIIETKRKDLIPKIEFSNKLIEIPGFQDEFMQHLDLFSKSWRKMIEDQRKFD